MFESPLENQAVQEGAAFSAFCVTLYNEHSDNLKQTISSVVDSIYYGAALRISECRNVCICIVVDGVNSAHASTLHWLRERELLSSTYSLSIDRCSLYYYEDDIAEVASKFGSIPLSKRDIIGVDKVGFLIILKDENRGKLHSHSVFFSQICEHLDPTYCFQLDVGTTLDVKAYYQICQEMDNRRDVGALAPCISTKHPNNQDCAVAIWQHMDFVVQKTVGWPSEVATGHLSVIPGQFCVIRWKALRSKEVGGQARLIDFSDQPIARYLRGIGTLGPVERIMYLAEDRVMGNEIALQEGSQWRLEYDSSSKATTDACPTILELLRQRRRWNNSAMVCKAHFIGRLPYVLRQKGRPVRSKISFALSALYQAILFFIDFFIPAIQFSFFYTLYKAVISSEIGLSIVTMSSLIAFLSIVAFVELNLHLKFTKMDCNFQQRMLNLFALPAAVTSLLTVSNFLPKPYVYLVYAPILFFILACMMVFRRDAIKMLAMYPYYMIMNSFISPLISFYSMLRFDRVSWGTKGLVSEKDATISDRLKRLRNIVFASWVSINMTAILLSIGAESAFRWPVNPIFVATSTIMSVISFISVVVLSSKYNFTRLLQRAGLRRRE